MRAVDVALVAIGVTAVVEGQRIVRVELDRLIEVGDGAVGVALGAVGNAAVVIGDRVAPG